MLEISLEFKTSESNVGLFCLRYCSYDRNFMLRNGVPHIRVYSADNEEKELKPEKQEDLELNFADN